MNRFFRVRNWLANRAIPQTRSTLRERGNPFLSLEQLEDRLTPTGNIVLTSAAVVNSNDQVITTINEGEEVYIQAKFTTEGLPSSASYRVSFTVNGMTDYTGYMNSGAGGSGTQSWNYYWGTFLATDGTNDVTVTVDPDHSVAETSYADNTKSFTFTAVAPQVGNLSYTVAQIRDAYGINDIADFGNAAPDGSGQTIAIVDAYDNPSIFNELDGFDQQMDLTETSTESLYQQYGAASKFLTVYNQHGVNITSKIGSPGTGTAPKEVPASNSGWADEEIGDVEWAHAIAPGAKIDLIEADNVPGLITSDGVAAGLPGVSVVSNSFCLNEWSGETSDDSSIYVTPAGHTGVTFLVASGDDGDLDPYSSGAGENYYPSASPNVISVGGTQLIVNNDTYGSESGWSFPAPSTVVGDSGGNFKDTGSWASHSGGYGGSYLTASAGSSSTAVWTIPISSTDTGWSSGTEISTTWIANASNATNATYTIYNGTEATGKVLGTVTINQTKAPVGIADGSSKFQELGVYFPTLSAKGAGTITVVLNAASANGTVEANAVGAAQDWASTGGASAYETEPAYQKSFQSTGYRTTPDVSFDASENTRMDGGFGTSVACPSWAGIIAIVNQGRVALGGSTLNSTSNPQQAVAGIYSLPSSDFNQITSGYNGTSAVSGYNFVTGRGSPIASVLVKGLVNYQLDNPDAIVATGDPTSENGNLPAQSSSPGSTPVVKTVVTPPAQHPWGDFILDPDVHQSSMLNPLSPIWLFGDRWNSELSLDGIEPLA